MITAQEVARISAQGIAFNRAAPAIAPAAPAAALRERLLLVVLYITVLASSVAFIEPSPHDGLMGVLAFACLIAGIRFERHVALLFLLLLIFNVAGLLSLLNVPGQEQTVQYAATSIYLGIAAVLFASLFAHNTMPRIATVRAAYVLTATVISLAGIAGYFHLFPGAHDLFATNDRALGGFKDPNVFGPFLIWPALVVLDRILVRRARLADVIRGRHSAARAAVELLARRLVSLRGVLRRHDRARLPHGGNAASAPAHLRHDRDRHRRAGGVCRDRAVVRFDRRHVPRARAAHSIL